MVFVAKISGSCVINYNASNGVKELKFPVGVWNKNPKIDNTLNGHFIVPDTDYTVVDIDDLTTNDNQKIMEKYYSECNYVVKTKKGVHLYFKYESKLASVNKIHKVDIIHNKRKMLFCPPSYYTLGDGSTFTYTFLKNDEPSAMPEGLVKFILKRHNSRVEKTTEALVKSPEIIKAVSAKPEPVKIQKEFSNLSADDNIIREILMSLDISRADEYNDWFKVLMILKNEGFKYELFQEFSQRSEKYDDNVKSIWDNYKSNMAKNQITLSSLWFMLKEDNPTQYFALKQKDTFKDYTFVDYKPSGSFSSKIFLKLWDADVNALGKAIVNMEVLPLTNSFKYFNSHHAKISTLGFVRIDYDNSLKTFVPLNKEFLNSLNEANYTDKDKTTYFLDLYDKCMTKNIYDKFVFEPLLENENVLNMFGGFKYDTPTSGKINIIQPYLDFIKHVINNEKQYTHFLKWVAHIIQKPNIKQTTCYVFYSYKHGVGKNTMLLPIQNLLEGYVYTITDTNALTAKFNGETLGKLLCIGDEIKTIRHGENLMNIIKNLLTQTKRSVEFKGKDKQTCVSDFCHYVFTTNNENNFYLEQTDRRFNMVECNKKLMSREVYAEINNISKNTEFLTELFYFFKTLDISDFDPFLPLNSDYKERVSKKSLPIEIKIVANMANELDGKFITNGDLITTIKNKLPIGKKARSSKIVITSLVDEYKLIMSRPWLDDKTRANYGFSFEENSKTGKHNIEILRNLMDDNDEDINDFCVGEDLVDKEINGMNDIHYI